MADPPKHPRHIRVGTDEEGRHPPLRFQDRITLPKVGRSTPTILVLAIVIVLGGLVGSTYLRRMGGVSSDAVEVAAPVAAEGEFGPISPSGEADRKLVIFTWASHPRAEGYELRLEDAAGRPLWLARLGEDTQVALPEDVSRQLVPGGAYVWRMVALFTGGRREESRSLAFVVR